MTVGSQSTAEKYHFIVPLWGAKYVDMFVNYSLPSQLSPGNLPALPAGMTIYEIYTTPEDAAVLDQTDSIKRLRTVAEVSIKTFREEDVLLDMNFSRGRYVQNLQKMTWCYQQALAACRGIDAAFVFMTPDSVWADGAFRFMHDCQSAGVRALMALGLITVRPLLQARLADFAVPTQGVIDIPPRRLVSLACDALHPLGISRLVRDGSARWNSAFYWMRQSHGMVARCFYLHPVMVRPRVHLERMPCTVDYRYVQQACPDLGEVRVVTDSDDLFYVDMADLQHVGEALPLESYSQEGIADWMCEWTDEFHRTYFQQPIILREDGADDFDEELAESRTFAHSLLERYEERRPALSHLFRPSNVFSTEDYRPALSKPSSSAGTWSLVTALRNILAPLQEAAKPAAAALRWTVRNALWLFFRRFYVRIAALEKGLEESQLLFNHWKAHLVRTEYMLFGELTELRAALRNNTAQRPTIPHVDPSDSARVAG